MLIVRAVFAFLALPGMVAGVGPFLIARRLPLRHDTLPFALAVLALGCCCLLWCVRDFFVSGRGTLAPWDPPKQLVIVGLYRCVRNPMYVAVLTILTGWALAYASIAMALYLMTVAVLFHLRVLLHEEPWLGRRFGPDWQAYSSTVHRWLPRWPA